MDRTWSNRKPFSVFKNGTVSNCSPLSRKRWQYRPLRAVPYPATVKIWSNKSILQLVYNWSTIGLQLACNWHTIGLQIGPRRSRNHRWRLSAVTVGYLGCLDCIIFESVLVVYSEFLFSALGQNFYWFLVVFISTCLVTVTPQCILFSEMVKKDSHIKLEISDTPLRCPLPFCSLRSGSLENPYLKNL